VIRLGAAERRIDYAAEALDRDLGKCHEHKRADKKPRALLERFPAEAEGGTWREAHGCRIAHDTAKLMGISPQAPGAATAPQAFE
jgi:hypothetical protein